MTSQHKSLNFTAMDSGMDGLDAMMAELTPGGSNRGGSASNRTTAAKKPVAKAAVASKAPVPDVQRAKSNLSVDDTTPTPVPTPVAETAPRAKGTAALNARGRRMVQRLRKFHLDLADPATREKLNETLASKSDDYETFISYYETDKDHTSFTVNVDMKRMQYRLTPPEEGRDDLIYTTEIKRYLERMLRSAKPGSESRLLVGMANQSLIADLLHAIQEHMIAPHDPEGELSVTTRNLSSVFHIDLRNRNLHAECVFVISTAGEDGQPGLQLAKLTGEITVVPMARCVEMRLGQLEMAMVFDHDLETAAMSLQSWDNGMGGAVGGSGTHDHDDFADDTGVGAGGGAGAHRDDGGGSVGGLVGGLKAVTGGLFGGLGTLVSDSVEAVRGTNGPQTGVK